MGGTSKQQQQVNQVQTQAPWAPAQGLLQGILGQAQPLAGQAGINPQEQSAFQQLMANAGAGNPYAQQIGGVANTLLGGGGFDQLQGGISNALGTLQGQLSPYASGSMVGANNPYINSLLDTLGSDISGRIRSQYAGAGRDFSGLEAQNIARGQAAGLAPVLLGQYNQDVQNQLGAANALFGAAGTTTGLLGNLTGQGLAARGTGIDAATAALAARDSPFNQQLAIQQAMRGIPLQQLGALTQLGVPIASLGGTGTKVGEMTGTSTLSPAQQAWGWMNAFANLGGAFKPTGGGAPPVPIGY